jgi:hypothetical protein
MNKWRLPLVIFLSLFLAFGLFFRVANASKEELEEIQKAIKESGAK